MEKHSVSRLSYLFAHLHLLSSDSCSSTLLSSNLSLLSASALLCFSSVHIVGSLTSKTSFETARSCIHDSSTVLLDNTFFWHLDMLNPEAYCLCALYLPKTGLQTVRIGCRILFKILLQGVQVLHSLFFHITLQFLTTGNGIEMIISSIS